MELRLYYICSTSNTPGGSRSEPIVWKQGADPGADAGLAKAGIAEATGGATHQYVPRIVLLNPLPGTARPSVDMKRRSRDPSRDRRRGKALAYRETVRGRFS